MKLVTVEIVTCVGISPKMIHVLDVQHRHVMGVCLREGGVNGTG